VSQTILINVDTITFVVNECQLIVY